VSTVLACDRCGTSKEIIKTVRLWYESHPDPSGNGQEDDFYIVDICSDCLFSFMRSLHNDYEFQPLMAKRMKDFVNKMRISKYIDAIKTKCNDKEKSIYDNKEMCD
jgi:hypothetical protein